MTILTPTFAERGAPNGQGGPIHVMAAHEPLKPGDGMPASGAAPSSPDAVPTGSPPALGTEVPQLQVKPLKVAIIGTAPSSRMLAPFNDPSWTIWCCSPGNMNTMPRVDAWFEIHSNLTWPKHQSYGLPYIEWLKNVPFPVFMQDNSLVPKALTFPMFELVQEFGQDFFTSSFAWMMALAIKQGAAEIALYGVDMASRNEYILQRPGFYYFRYMAERRGIKVSAPHESDIMQSPPLYGYVDSTPFGRKIVARRDEINERIAGMTPQRDQLNHNITYLQGAQEDVDYFESIWSGLANEVILSRGKIAQLEAEIARLSQSSAPAPAPLPVQAPAIAPEFAGAETRPRRRRRKMHEPIQLAPVSGEFKLYTGADLIVTDDPHMPRQSDPDPQMGELLPPE